MVTSLFKIPLDIEETRVRQIYRSSFLDQAQMGTITCEEMKETYGDLRFEALHEDRPHTYTPLVTPIDGKIASTDVPQGPPTAKLNKYDGDGAGADWWIPNMLRAVSDGGIIGVGTINVESDYMAHVFSQQLEDTKVAAGMEPVPWNIISSLGATGIPSDYVLFKAKEVLVMINTSAAGVPVIRKKMKEDCYLVGPVGDIPEVIGETIESMKANRNKVLAITIGDKTSDPKVVLYIMKKFGFSKVLMETLSYMRYLVSQDMVDELFFNYSCICVGRQALTIGKSGQESGSEDHPHTGMLSIHSHSDHFFCFRHKLTYGQGEG